MLLLRRSVLKTEEPVDPRQVARDAGLRYVCDEQAGIRRVRHGKGFIFIEAHGKPVRDEATLGRIRKLAIPPAWENVWICAAANGHIQAIGRDAAGRKQYRYHAMWATVRSAHKYDRLVEFAEALKKVRARVDKDLERPGIDRLRVIATVVRLMDLTLMRVGNEEYADRHKHYGLTTMRDGHVKFRGDQLRFTFVGKSGQKHDIEATAPRLAKLVKRCQDLPGQQLFQYVDDDGEVRGISSEDVNDYLRETTGMNITAKDFRTWGGTVIAARLLAAGGSRRRNTPATSASSP
jgi:DNA topoisomerase-1